MSIQDFNNIVQDFLQFVYPLHGQFLTYSFSGMCINWHNSHMHLLGFMNGNIYLYIYFIEFNRVKNLNV